MVEPAAAEDWVKGEAYELLAPEEVLPVLDRYEGYTGDRSRPGLFERCRRDVCFSSGAGRPCWVYLYRGPVEEERRIWSGDYLGGRDDAPEAR
jgi:gamma-glutamylcyclotransferase (GGCT)/AIG2-like uncharacterized protein YtfP